MTFQPGQSGNPAGKPKGSRNKATLAAETLLDGEAETITRKVIELAKPGDIFGFAWSGSFQLGAIAFPMICDDRLDAQY